MWTSSWPWTRGPAFHPACSFTLVVCFYNLHVLCALGTGLQPCLSGSFLWDKKSKYYFALVVLIGFGHIIVVNQAVMSQAG